MAQASFDKAVLKEHIAKLTGEAKSRKEHHET